MESDRNFGRIRGSKQVGAPCFAPPSPHVKLLLLSLILGLVAAGPLTASAPSSLTATRLADGSVMLTWPTLIGGWYQVETSDDLVRWTLLGSSTEAAATLMTWTDDGTLTGTHPSTAAKRFYRIRDWGVFDVTFTATRFTYNDSERTVTGLFRKPALPGRLPALVINHGTGGSTQPNGFTDRRAQEMSPWGLFCIGPDLTHASGAVTDLNTFGFSPATSPATSPASPASPCFRPAPMST